MEIGAVLSRAWQIIWKHKVLWIFGILAGCGSTSTGSGNFRYSAERGNLPPEVQRFFDQFNFNQFPEWQIYLFAAIALAIILLLVVISIFLGTIGRVGLVRGTQQAEHGAERLSFGELFSGSTPYFWRVFGLNVLVGLAIFLVFMILIILVVAGSVVTLGIGAICLVPLICIAVPLAWFLSVVIEQSSIAIVLENLGIMDGLRRGWEVVRANLGTMIVMALILLLGVGLVGGLILGLPLIAIVAPAVLGAASGSDQGLGGGLMVAGLCFVVYLPVLIVLNGVLRGYIETAWTLTFMRLTGRSAEITPAPLT